MPTRDTQAHAAANLLAETSSASLSVVSSRLLALANPLDFLSRRQQRETSRMVSEKLAASFDGCMFASAELAALPYRMLLATAKPSTLTPAVCMEAWMAWGGLWIGVGNAALKPAHKTVVGNRARLRRAGKWRESLCRASVGLEAFDPNDC
jgi:hypothetical protein